MDEDSGFFPPGEEQHTNAHTEFGMTDSAWDGSLPDDAEPAPALAPVPCPAQDEAVEQDAGFFADCPADCSAGSASGDAAKCESGGPSDSPADFPAQSGSVREGSGPRLLGIRLRKAGQVYFIADTEHTVRPGTKVVVEFEQGPSLGEVVSVLHDGIPATADKGAQTPGQAFGQDDAQTPGKVLGLATAQDIAQHTENSILAAEASAFCKTCIRQRSLDMKLVDVEVLHDRSKIIFFFTAPSRIDFRELVKDLVRNYRTRIELRQIGVRHETQMIGGLGNCGMVCCCHQYLRKFAPVTIKMAKEQNLFLNPAKLSGMCGRLLCCLSFEQGNYEEFNRRCPKLGKRYVTAKGMMKVLRANLFTRSIVVLSEAGEEIEMPLEEWDGLEPKRAEPPAPDQHRASGPRGDGVRGSAPRKEDGSHHGENRPEEGGHERQEGEHRARHHRPRKRRRE